MNLVQCEVQIQDLAGSFDRLWSAAASAYANLARALTRNILLVVEAEDEDRAKRLIRGILSRHPCRALVILIDDAATQPEAHLEACVSDHHSSHLMVLEQLTLRVSLPGYRLLPNLLRPVLIDDIPKSLVWGRQLPDSLGRLSALAALCERTIVDSSLFEGDDWRSLRQLLGHPMFDLASLRLTPWRRNLAEAFEHFNWEPDTHDTLICIGHGPGSPARNASRCLEAWLQLKLQARIRLEEHPDAPRSLEPQSLSLVHGPNKVLISPRGDGGQLALELTLGDYCRMPSFIRASQGSRADLLAAALDSRDVLQWPVPRL